MRIEEEKEIELKNKYGATIQVSKDSGCGYFYAYLKSEGLTRPVGLSFFCINDLNIYLKSMGFQTIEDEFILVDFLNENLKPKKFEFNECNTYFVFDGANWDGWNETVVELPTVHFECIDKFVTDTLTKEGVTMKQLIRAFKELNWI